MPRDILALRSFKKSRAEDCYDSFVYASRTVCTDKATRNLSSLCLLITIYK